MVKTTAAFQLTDQQKAILDACPHAPEASSKQQEGKLIRITAAAGSGKTTTLLALAVEAIQKKGHRNILYVTFSRSAADDGKRRIHQSLAAAAVASNQQLIAYNVEARTLHSLAQSLLQNDDEEKMKVLTDDHRLKDWIAREFSNEIDKFLAPCYQTIRARSKSQSSITSKQKRAHSQVIFFLFKTLENFCRKSITVKQLKSRSTWVRVYFPAKTFHANKRGDDWGFSDRFYKGDGYHWYGDMTVQIWQRILEKKLYTFDAMMKRVQLDKRSIPRATLLLVDESQDMDSCQIDWICSTQVKEHGKHAFVVGDPAQLIYRFRGARAQDLMELPTSIPSLQLTQSWRFGSTIARMANVVLFAKHQSQQTAYISSSRNPTKRPKFWDPYRIQASSSVPGVVRFTSALDKWSEQKLTLIARTNATLMLQVLPLFGFEVREDGTESEMDQTLQEASMEKVKADDTAISKQLPKVHVFGKGENGGVRGWKNTIKMLHDVYGLYENQGLAMRLPFREFEDRAVTWKEFVAECEDRTLPYIRAICVVQAFQEQTPKAVEVFQQEVIDKSFSEEQADIILTTCHAAKGMEWDVVEVCNDFVDVCDFMSMANSDAKQDRSFTTADRSKSQRTCGPEGYMFAFPDYSDELNMLYVACTRAKRTLVAPPNLIRLLTEFDRLSHYAKQERTEEHETFFRIEGPKKPLQLKDKEQVNLFNRLLVEPLRQEIINDTGEDTCTSIFAALISDAYLHLDSQGGKCETVKEEKEEQNDLKSNDENASKRISGESLLVSSS